MVDSIVPQEDTSTVHVKLGYQASLKNVREKLGGLAAHVAVSKLSTFVQDSELVRLEELKRQYGIVVPGEPAGAKPAPTKAKKKVFKKRAAPYKPPSVQHSPEFQDAQEFPGPADTINIGDTTSDGE